MGIDEIKDMLLANHNIILHGAPGTGKTYLAKEIAKAMCGVNDIKELEDSGQFKMVQFHPSYDYTDFVEGLRPTGSDNNGNIIFARQDGVFKKFCKNAINARPILSELVPTNNNSDVVSEEEMKEAWKSLLTQFVDNQWCEIDLKSKNYKAPIKRLNDTIVFVKSKQRDYDDKKNQNIVTYDTYRKLFAKFNDKLSEISHIKQSDFNDIIWCKSSANAIRRRIYDIIIANRSKSVTDPHQPTPSNIIAPFIFLIDEINRGDMSKIFGELFYAIDPGYRGEDGKIDTQYQNLVAAQYKDENGVLHDDPFHKGFYVPDNVYIIGTMNDIDRSVESMDFAMRRRFQFIEVTAESRAEGMGLKTKGDDITNYDANDAYARMTNLNNCIISKEIGLSKAYQIGGSYFLKKVSKPIEDKSEFDNLWKYKLEGLLREYLRGEENDVIEKKIESLEKAFNDGQLFKDSKPTNESTSEADTSDSDTK